MKDYLIILWLLIEFSLCFLIATHVPLLIIVSLFGISLPSLSALFLYTAFGYCVYFVSLKYNLYIQQYIDISCIQNFVYDITLFISKVITLSIDSCMGIGLLLLITHLMITPLTFYLSTIVLPSVWALINAVDYVSNIDTNTTEINTTTVAINDEQNTHTASVHKSVNTSIYRLLKNYPNYNNNFNPHYRQRLMHSIYYFILPVQNSSPPFKFNAAMRYLGTYLHYHHDMQLEGDSSATYPIMLVLNALILAIMDNNRRIGEIDDARQTMVNALYEIQRGYNITDGADDNSIEDYPICVSGAVNKLIEHFCGTLPDCEIEFITKETAMLKAKALIKRRSIEFLSYFGNGREIDYIKSDSNTIAHLKNHLFTEVFQKIWHQFKNEFLSQYDLEENLNVAFEYTTLDSEKLNQIEKERRILHTAPIKNYLAPLSVYNTTEWSKILN